MVILLAPPRIREKHELLQVLTFKFFVKSKVELKLKWVVGKKNNIQERYSRNKRSFFVINCHMVVFDDMKEAICNESLALAK